MSWAEAIDFKLPDEKIPFSYAVFSPKKTKLQTSDHFQHRVCKMVTKVSPLGIALIDFALLKSDIKKLFLN